MIYVDNEYRRLDLYRTRIPSLVVNRINDARLQLMMAQKDLSQSTKNCLSAQRHKLEMIKQRIYDASPERILAKGYSLTLKDGKLVTDATQVTEGDELVTRLMKGEIKSIVNQKSK